MKISNTKWAFLTIGLGAVLACLLPWLLTSRSWFGINFLETGPVGDTIGGIAGPVLNFAGLLVIYFSLREQLAANEKQTESIILQREALDDQKRQVEAELRDSQNEKYFELTYKLLEKLAGAVHRNESVFAEIAQHDYNWNYHHTISTNEQDYEEAHKNWLRYVWKIGDMFNLFSIIMKRMDNEILTIDQKQLLASLVELQYISKLNECRIAYQGLFKDIEQTRPEQLIIVDDQREKFFLFEERLTDSINEDRIPWG